MTDSDRQKRRVLIFGISGQDGAYLARFLTARGYDVHGTSRDVEVTSFRNLDAMSLRERVGLHSAVVTDPNSVRAAILTVDPDEIYNLSGQTSVGLSYSQPGEALGSIAMGTLNILETIREYKPALRLYNACSGECFGDTGGSAANEATPFRPMSPYSVAKSTAFWLVSTYRRSYGLFACSGVLFNHESPLRPERFVTRKVALAAARISLGSAKQLQLGNLAIVRDWGWAPDYVESMWRMLQQPQPKDYVIATGRSVPLSYYVEACFNRVGRDWREHVIRDERLFRPSDPAYGAGDASLARSELGWVPAHDVDDVARLMTDAALAQLKGQPFEQIVSGS